MQNLHKLSQGYDKFSKTFQGLCETCLNSHFRLYDSRKNKGKSSLKPSKYFRLVLSNQNLAQVLTRTNEYSRALTTTKNYSRLLTSAPNYVAKYPLVQKSRDHSILDERFSSCQLLLIPANIMLNLILQMVAFFSKVIAMPGE